MNHKPYKTVNDKLLNSKYISLLFRVRLLEVHKHFWGQIQNSPSEPELSDYREQSGT